MTYAVQTYLVGLAMGGVFGFAFGRARGFAAGHRDAWELAHRLFSKSPRTP